MLKYVIALLSILFFAESFAQENEIEVSLDAWHKAAEEADFKSYFGLMTSDAVFVGSDASEVWNFEEFKAFSKPYFEAGKAWTFKPVTRNIYLDETQSRAWFDEILDSKHMGICRGSGVLTKDPNGIWKIQHYVLSLAVPNPLVKQLVEMKSKLDHDFLESQH